MKPLQHSSGPIGTVSDISRYREEIEKFIGGVSVPKLISTDETVENPTAFALEEHLEDFLVKNWAQTELGKDYDIYEEDGEKGQQYQTDTGPLDILAISKDKRRLLVVELKKGRASDAVLGYMLALTHPVASCFATVRDYPSLKTQRLLSARKAPSYKRYKVDSDS